MGTNREDFEHIPECIYYEELEDRRKAREDREAHQEMYNDDYNNKQERIKNGRKIA